VISSHPTAALFSPTSPGSCVSDPPLTLRLPYQLEAKRGRKHLHRRRSPKKRLRKLSTEFPPALLTLPVMATGEGRITTAQAIRTQAYVTASMPNTMMTSDFF
jgi:hypothetical protein